MKIFVSICSYRDPLLHFTVESLIQNKSERTDAVYSIFEQCELSDSLEIKYPELIERSDVIYKRIDPQFSEGVGWARKINSLNATDEDFYYQIDSHMVFDKNWDRTLVNDYKRAMIGCQTNRIVISSNCKGFDMINGVPCLQHNRNVATIAGFYQFGKDFKLYAHGDHVQSNGELRPTFNLFAGNLFTHLDWLDNVGINHKMFFHGEEQIFTLASFAAGYRMFTGSSICCYHYNDSNSHTSKQDINPIVSDFVIAKRRENSDKELIRFIQEMDDGILEDFYRESGIDYINRKLEERAITRSVTSNIQNDWEI